MPAIATRSCLNDYPRLNIAKYKEQLKNGDAKDIKVSYSYKEKSYSYSIALSKTIPNYGGNRYWWLCPSCSKRVTVLFCAGVYVCRHCLQVPYGSQLEQPIDRLFSRLNTIRARLEWQRGIANPQGGRPRYMHASTYDRLLCEYNHLVPKLVGAYRHALARP